MITFITFAFAWVLNYSLPWQVYAATGVIDGFVFIPILTFAFAPYLGMAMRRLVSRLQFLFGTTAAGGVVAVLFPDRYEYAPFNRDRGVLYTSEGVVEFDPERSHWYRLGNQPFGVTWYPSEQVIGKYLDDDAKVVSSSDKIGALDRVRAGVRSFTQYPDLDREDGFIASWSRAAADLRGGANIELSETAEEKVLKEWGGGREVNMKWLVIGGLGAMISASVVGVLIFGFL